jgi:hypothetical protein
MDVDREAACDDRVVSRTGATRRYASSLLTVAAAANPESEGIEFVDGVSAATTTASDLRVRVGRLLDPRRDRGAQLASATSLVSVAGLMIAVVMSTQVAPVVVFLGAAAVTVDAWATAPVIELRRERVPAPRANVNAAGGALELPRRTRTRLKRSTPSRPPEAAAHPIAGTPPLDAPPPATAPLDSRIMAVDNVPVLTVSLPSSLPHCPRRNRLPARGRQPIPRPPGKQSGAPPRLPPALLGAPLWGPAPAPGTPASRSAVF